jgi:antitoxin (DNA-binding transcriptional repressor) of toxin-antitoxin stability system
MGKVEVSNAELRTVRDAMRELNRLVEELEHGETEKFVLTKHGRMRAVVVSVDYFATLRSSLGETAQLKAA